MLTEQELDYFEKKIFEIYGINLPRDQIQDQISKLVQLIMMVDDFKETQFDLKETYLQETKNPLQNT